MSTLFDPFQRQRQIERLKKLTPETKPAWGKLTARDVYVHLADPIRTGLDEFEAPLKRSFFSTRIGKWLIIYGIRKWPNSPPTHPRYDIEKEGRRGKDFFKEQAELIEVIGRLANTPPDFPFRDHSVFGRISRNTWGHLMDKHIEHHLRQFGL